MSFWIRTEEKPQTSGFYYFTKEIDIDFDPATASSAVFKVCADSRYRLYVNGVFAGEGPCQGSEYSRYYETYETDELRPLLKKGRNEICAKVLWLGENDFISVYRSTRPSLWIDGMITGGTTGENGENGTVKVPVETDATWTCRRDDSVTFHYFPGVHVSTAPGEDHHGDSSFTAVPVILMNPPEQGGYNIFGLSDTYPLEKRPIPPMKYEPAKTFSEIRSGEGFTELDAGTYTTAIPTVRAEGAPGTVIKIIYSESYVQKDENGNGYKGLRDAVYTDNAAEFSGSVYDVLRIPGSGKAVLTPFWYRAFRFVRLESTDPSVRYTELSYQPYFYPFPEEGTFECSDAMLGKMWEISINTVKCCAHEIYIDCPYYEQQQYDMDSCLEMLFTQRMIADPQLPFKSINDLARSQIFNGLLQANYPSVFTQIIPNFTMYWVIMFREYLRYAPYGAGTRAQAASLMGTLDKALDSFELFRDETGLFGANPYWNFIDWVPGWHVGVTPGGNDGEPITVSSMIYTAALRNASEIAAYCGRDARAAEYRDRADALAEIIKEKCYDKEAGLFRNTPYRREFSEHTSLWAVLAGIVSGSEAEALMTRTMDGDVPVAHCSFSMGSFLFRAVEKAGVYDRYAARLFSGWQKMIDCHCTTWCENPDSPRSECHGWSSAPAYEFSAMILGAYPAEDGYRMLRVRPHLWALDTEWAKGSVPTPYGLVRIGLERETPAEGRRFSISVTLPDGRVFSKNNCSDGDVFEFRLG